MVGYGVVRYGMVRNGTVWYGLKLFLPKQYCPVPLKSRFDTNTVYGSFVHLLGSI